jgi:lycopene cyclase CruA
LARVIALESDTEEKSIFARLARHYPKTVAAFEAMPEGEVALRAVAGLERNWVETNSKGAAPAATLHYVRDAAALPPCPRENSYDIVIAGGGLGLIAGAALAARGLRVMVFDRDRVGAAHREWNISRRELSSLVDHGLFSWNELQSTIAARYSRGVISFDGRGTGVAACPLQLEGVLDVALDAQSLLDLARRRFVEAGGTILEGRSFLRLQSARRGTVASVFEIEGPDGPERYRARLAVDTMGSVSPIAMTLNKGLPFDGVCPTAGTVIEGLDIDPTTGDVLVSVAPVQGGRQLIWEGFPGRDRESTVYLFYYDRTGPERAESQSLLELFERYFTLLPTYRSVLPGHRHLKPVFGYIPARHGRTGRAAARGLICLGDSAAGQSPLTFCGFGSFVRHIGRVAMLIDFALEHDLLEERHLTSISPYQANLRVAWVFSRFMRTWPGGGDTGVNRLMNVFCRALSIAGPGATTRFLQDRYTFRDYIRIMLLTARHYPFVFAVTARALGPAGLLKWVGDILYFAGDDLLRTAHRWAGPGRWKALERAARRHAPAIALKSMALRTRWDAAQPGSKFKVAKRNFGL